MLLGEERRKCWEQDNGCYNMKCCQNLVSEQEEKMNKNMFNRMIKIEMTICSFIPFLRLSFFSLLSSHKIPILACQRECSSWKVISDKYQNVIIIKHYYIFIHKIAIIWCILSQLRFLSLYVNNLASYTRVYPSENKWCLSKGKGFKPI